MTEEEEQCGICFGTLEEDVLRTACCPARHYHRPCIVKWFNMLVVATCPQCRRAVPERPDWWQAGLQWATAVLRVAYFAAMTYEMFGLLHAQVCRDDWNPVVIAIAVFFSSLFYSALLLPAYAVTALYWCFYPWPVAHRFADMCGTVAWPFNYRCHQYQPVLHGWEGGFEYIVYGHVVYNRAFECTRYVMTGLLIVLQLALLALAYYRRHSPPHRHFHLVRVQP